jgi:trehalose 6-phosphate phosphatase
MHELLEPLRERPQTSGVMLDIDGTLAPIVAKPQDASVPSETRELLAALGRRYRLLACLSGRRALDARRLVALDSITYVGNHGLEYLEPGAERPREAVELSAHTQKVESFAKNAYTDALRELGVRLEDKEAIWSFHWREARNTAAARTALDQLADDAKDEGLVPHWGRMVLEIRPAVHHGKGLAIEALVKEHALESALYAGDDMTDLDAFRMLRALRSSGDLVHTVCVGVGSREGPAAIVEEADIVVAGPEEILEILRELAA